MTIAGYRSVWCPEEDQDKTGMPMRTASGPVPNAVIVATMNVVFLIVNVVSLYAMVQYLHMWYIGAQIVHTVVISALSYIVSDWIFKE